MTAEGGGAVPCCGTTEVTHRWVMLPWGLTWRSDAHVLLAVHHETSHRLPIGVIGRSLTYWKSAEHCSLATAKRVASSHNPPPPGLREMAIDASSKNREKHLLFEFSAGLTSLLSFGLISYCEFGNEVSDPKSRDTGNPGSSCCHC